MYTSAIRYMTSDCDYADGVFPDDEMGPFLPISEAEVETFNDVLSDEVDSDYASSICCCDFCYDDFKGHWPDVAFRQMDFQQQSMEAAWYLDHSRMATLYTPAEMSTLRHFVRCPRCFNTASCNLWIYEHRFSDSEDIERNIDHLLTLGRTTPFLLLEHPFAQDVLNEIRRRALNMKSAALPDAVYRARIARQVLEATQLPDAIETYGAPPAPKVVEGRFNHAGTPMLYLASSDDTAAAELGTPGTECFVGALRLIREVKVLDLLNIEEGEDGWDLLQALAQSALLSAPHSGEGWVRREYIFSRFVADCARSAGFDAIRYGSTKHPGGSNLVIIDPAENLRSIASLESWSAMVVPDPSLR
jgi:RES domain